ncbi:hypothetical protein [Streptomyces capparidis]
MPANVRAARITNFVTMGLCVLVGVIVGALEGWWIGVEKSAINLPGVALLVLAFWYGRGGAGVRISTIVVASIQILCSLINILKGSFGGFYALTGAIILIALFNQDTARHWFDRPRPAGPPPHMPGWGGGPDSGGVQMRHRR